MTAYGSSSEGQCVAQIVVDLITTLTDAGEMVRKHLRDEGALVQTVFFLETSL